MPQTVLNKHTYPSENQDPFFEIIKNLFSQQDNTMWGNKMRGYALLVGGGNKTFNSGSGLFTWDEDFAVKNCFSGFFVKYSYGPTDNIREANLQEGDLLIATFPFTMSQTETRQLSVSQKVDHTDNFLILGVRFNNKLYLKSGEIL